VTCHSRKKTQDHDGDVSGISVLCTNIMESVVSFNAQINTFINVAFWKIEIYPVDLAISYKKMTSFYFNLEF